MPSTPLASPPPAHAPLRLTGRRSSHFTRVVTMLAHELGVPFELEAVTDLTALDPAAYGGHPAMKIPTLHLEGGAIFGAENICRKLVLLAGRKGDARIVLPEHVDDDLARSAQELTWIAMSAQVQLIVGIGFAKLPAESIFFTKTEAGLRGALVWLDARVDDVRARLPSPRDVSVFEVTLFCLLEHLVFRPSVALDPYPRLRAFAGTYGERPSARLTPFRREGAIDPVAS